MFVAYFFWLVVIALEVALVVHILRLRLVRRYPYFFGYLLVVCMSDLSRWVSYHHGSEYYPWVYWISESLTILVGFLLVWEIFRHTFSAFPAIRQAASWFGLILVVFALVANGLLVLSGVARWDHPLLQAGRWLRLLQGAFLAAIIATARHYLLPLGRNIAGLAIGFGLFVSLAVVNFISLAMGNIDLSQFSHLYAGTYILALIIWYRSFWVYAPNPAPQPLTHLERDYDRVRATMGLALKQVRANLRKGLGA